MKLYVEAYTSDDRQVPGNCDGQLVWEGKRYKQTTWYKMLRWRYTIKRIAYYLLKAPDGRIVERIEHELPDDE